ncbi:MAG TPA: hypothetical protein VL978_00215 [Puia sp.]|nr:hypothetical protein [Puia sp.]
MLVKGLLILVLIGCGFCLKVSAQLPVKPAAADTLKPATADTVRPAADTVKLHFPALAFDTLSPGSGTPEAAIDTLHPDSLTLARDSIRRADSIRQANYVPSATALQHQIDSANAASTLSGTNAVDSLKLRMDAMLAAAGSQQQPNAPPGSMAALMRQNSSPAYTPGAGASPAITGLQTSPPTNPPTDSPASSPARPPTGQSAGQPARLPTTGRQGSPPPFFARRNALPSFSNFHRKTIPVHGGHTTLDTLSIVPGTFSIRDIDTGAYRLDWVNSSLRWEHPPGKDSVVVYYRTFPYKLNAPGRRFSYDSIMNYFLVRPYDGRRSGNDDDNFFNFGNITYNGSFGRSISFGNSQDAVVTSNLNLQISGYLADSIRIEAAITDNNIPIQPDGTTADLNEFDKIYLQFSRKNWALTMGDIDLKQNQNYFLSFYKRLQGATFETTEKIGDHITNKVLTSAAIAKGKFNRNIFEGQEGNQGPYQLTGANNETFFIVLAGTEKVFIDGQLMQRGENADYTINYNTAQVTFTANRLITQDARIQVEFEYADRTYLNVNLYLYDEAHIGDKLKLRMGVFSNSDARNSPIDQTLTPQENAFLAGLGDSIQHAYYPVANVDTFAAGKILYQKVDTFYKNAAGQIVQDSIYEFSTNTAVTLYNLSFADVGQGYGNYVPDLNNVNGNVYIWVAPVNGVPQGSYEAAQFLVTPKTQQVITLGADYAIDKHTTLTADVAGSNYNINTLSTIEKNNDKGTAAKFTLKNTRRLNSTGLQLTSTLGYEYVQANFAPIEPLRSVEFTRDWGLTLSTNPATEKIYSAGFLVNDKHLNSLKYEIDRYERSDGFIGMRNAITHNQMIDSFHIMDQISLVTSDSNNFAGRYLKPSIDVSRRLPFLRNYTLGGNYSLEDNESKDKKADTLTATSFLFHTWTAYLKSPEIKRDHWGISYAVRDNSYAAGRSMALGDQSKTISVFADLLRNPHEQFHFTASYRTLSIVDSAVDARGTDSTSAAVGSGNTLLTRVEYLVNEWKGLVKGNLLYEIGAGQQQELSYTYLQVPAGTGQYAWIDYNHDGIQELNEFVLAQFPDQAQYIRVYTPSGIFVRAAYTTFNYSVSVTPKAFFGPKSSSFPLFLARMVLQSSLQMNQKQEANNGIQWNPFKSPLFDTALIFRGMVMANTFSFNRTDPHWGFDLSNTRTSTKSLLTYGVESHQSNEWSLRTRVNMNKSVSLTTTIRQGMSELINSSSNFDSSNYDLRLYSIEPDLIYTHKSNLRIGIGYALSTKVNSLEWGGQDYTSTGINTDFKYNILQSTSIQGKFIFSDILYTSKEGAPSVTSPASYTILEGLAPGKNYEWGLDFTKRLGSSLEISLQYDGRKPAGQGVINTGRAALRAIL